ncbi:general odorant-binding protein 56a [Nasonia vitripennis]|uniref:Uncharacterized protein n=2 Tax=Nasonia vitripennis TaxID=7425 RepID=A0A7M7G382_NASVI|nr:general odorant-binding protein 56a [Nasonia vitripennis]
MNCVYTVVEEIALLGFQYSFFHTTIMKVAIVACVLTICSIFAGSKADLTEDQRKILQPLKDECFQETGLDAVTLEKFKKEALQKFKTTGEVSNDEKVNCFSACMFKKIGFMSEEGKFEEDTVRALMSENFPPETLDKAIENCKNEVGKDHCETAAKLIVCFMNNKAGMENV